METTLHRQLKEMYAGDLTQQEVRVAGFRIDAVDGDRLIEIQQASLGAIRDKVKKLLVHHPVFVVKPLAARKYLVKRRRRNGPICSSRYSPSRATFYDLFDDLVHFVRVFPHPRLTLEIVLTEQEEHRIAKTRRRRFGRDYRVVDRRLIAVQDRIRLNSAGDLTAFLPGDLPDPFTTADIAQSAEIPRWLAQKMAYCLRETGAATAVGKQGNAVLHTVADRETAAA